MIFLVEQLRNERKLQSGIVDCEYLFKLKIKKILSIQGVSPGTESIDIEQSTHQKLLKIYIFTNVAVLK